MRIYRLNILAVLLYVLGIMFPTDLMALDSFVSPDTTRAHRFYSLALDQMKQGKYHEAMDLLDKAAKQFAKKKYWDRLIDCNFEKSNAWTSVSNREGIIEFWIETLELSKEKLGKDHVITGNCYNRLGELYYFENRNDKAKENLDKAMHIFTLNSEEETLQIAKVFTNYGRIKKAISEYDSVEYFLDKALGIQLRYMDTLDERLNLTYHTYGSYFYQIGNMDKSIHYHGLVLQIEKNKYGDKHREVADVYNNLGAAYQRKGEYNSALEYQQKALDIRLATLDSLHPYIALSYNNIANAYSSLGNYEISNEHHQKALAIRLKIFDENHRDIAMSYTNIGSNLLYEGFPEEALVYFKKVIPIIESNYGAGHMRTSDAYENAGLPFYYTGRLDSAFFYLFKALTIREKINKGLNIKVARSYNNIGAIYKENCDYNLALSYYFKSLELYKKLLGEKNYNISGSYNNIGQVYYLTDKYAKALEYYQKSLEIDKINLGEDNPILAKRFLNIGSVLASMGKFEESYNYNIKALQYQINAYGEENDLVCSILSNMAIDYFELDSLDKAIEYMARAIKIRSYLSNGKNPDLAEDFTNYGMILAKSGNRREGQNNLYKALSVNYFGKIPDTVNSDIDPHQIKDKGWFVETLVKIIEFNTKYLYKDNRFKLLEQNLTIYDLIAKITIVQREEYRFEQSKLFALKQWNYLYSEAFETAAELYKLTNDNKYFDHAFRFAGLKKASALTDAMASSQAMNNSGIPENIVDKEKALYTELESLKQSLLETEITEDNRNKIENLNSNINTSIIKLNNLYQSIEKEYPDYYDLRSHYPKYFPDDICNLLEKKTLLIDFIVTDSAIYSIVISKNNKWIERIEVPEDMDNKITDLLVAIKKQRANAYVSKSVELYKLLIEPLEKYFNNIEKLIIIPESYLLQFPLDILIRESSNPVDDFSIQDYLIKRFEIATHYSSELWARSFNSSSKRTDKQDGINDFLGFAPVFDSYDENSTEISESDSKYTDRTTVNRLSLKPLPYSENEINKLVELFNTYGKDARKMIRSEATEKNFRDRAGAYKFVHIATHGLINPEKPELSGLVFWSDTAKNKKDIPDLLISQKENDGVLYTKEIFNLNHCTDLVTLSACETGVGKLATGEGLLSFVRGFTFAGIPNMLISYWKVNDKSTSMFMYDFYEAILDGESYSSALRKAKLKAISEPSTAFPSTWGNFVLIGY